MFTQLGAVAFAATAQPSAAASVVRHRRPTIRSISEHG